MSQSSMHWIYFCFIALFYSGITHASIEADHINGKLLPTNCGIDVGQRTFGGEVATLSEHPWMALIRMKFRGRTGYICGGSLISNRYVVAPAHCVQGPKIPKTAVIDQVRLGEHDLNTALDCSHNGLCSPPTDDVEIEDIIVHPQFNNHSTNNPNDIALIRLRRDAKLSVHVQPICLPLYSNNTDNLDTHELTAVGWQRRTKTNTSKGNLKLRLIVPAINNTECRRMYNNVKINLTDSQICAGGQQDTCLNFGVLTTLDWSRGSDHLWFLVGLNSYGPHQCGWRNRPDVYTRISKYTEWILENLKP